jgi:hypothetical protein
MNTQHHPLSVREMSDQEVTTRYAKETLKLKTLNLFGRQSERFLGYPNTLMMNLCKQELDRRGLPIPTVNPQGEAPMTLDELLALKARRSKPLKMVHIGSTDKAKEAFQYWRLQDTLAGMIVLTIGADTSDEVLHISPEQKIDLDILHLSKIEEADLVRILNVGGYIGESTSRELDYARRLEKPIVWLEPEKT